MIRYNPKRWFELIFHAYSRFVLRTLLPALIFVGAFAALVCYLVLDYFDLDEAHFHSTTAIHSLLGVVLGLFLVFRLDSAYDRWWEGRKLWGSLVNNSRNFAMKLNAYLDTADLPTRAWFARMIPNYVFAVKEHLRKGIQLTEMEPMDDGTLDPIKDFNHKPNFISAQFFKAVNRLYAQKKLTGEQFFLLDKELTEFLEIIGSCERIRHTPIPYSYGMYIKKFIFTYVITLPFGFVTTFGYVTVPAVLFVSFILLSVELIAEEIEDPFGRDANDLPTDNLSTRIRSDVHEILLTPA